MDSYSSDSSYNAYEASESSVGEYSSSQHNHGNASTSGNRSTNVKCRYFMNNGYCFFGDQCQFQHVSGNGVAQQRSDFLSSEDDSAFTNPSSDSTSTFVSSAVPKHVDTIKQRSLFSKNVQTTTGKDQSELLHQQFRRMRIMQNVEKEAQQQHLQSSHAQRSNLQPVQFAGHKTDKTSFFMTQQMRKELEKQRSLLLTEVKDTGLPESIENYHSLFPLEDTKSQSSGQRLLGYLSSCYRVINSKDGLHYCMRRVHGFRLLNPKAVINVEKWKQTYNSNIVPLKEAFTTKAFGDTSLVFIYTYFPGAETLMNRHFSGSRVRSPPTADHSKYTWVSTSFPNNNSNTKSTNKVVPERLIWSYVIQLTAAIRQIHSSGLCCRVIDPTKVLFIGHSRLRLNCAGILDILTSDTETNASMLPHYQQEDLVALGKLILALACYSIEAVHRENMNKSLEFVTRNYSNDLKTLILYLLSSQVTSNRHSINEVMPAIGARFYSQLDSTQARADLLETELSKEIDNGRLLRILTKLGTILERSEHALDHEWSETGDRYLLKLFRDYLFHQVTEMGTPWIDFAHIVSTLNKLDVGSSERVCLSSRDELSILVVSYHDLKACLNTAFSELTHSSERLV